MEILSANNFETFEELDRVAILMGHYDRKNTGQRICLRTGIYEDDFNNHLLHQTPFKGRGWHADFRTYQYEGDFNDSKYTETMLKLRGLGYIWDAFTKYYDEKEQRDVIRSKPELIIYADNFTRALSAMRLIPAAISVFLDTFHEVEQYTCKYGWQLEEPFPYLLHEIPENRFSVSGLAQSIKLLARASHSNKVRYSMLRYWASKKLCAVDEMVTHGKGDIGGAGITDNPIAHTLFSQAIVLAYGAITEFGIDEKVNRKKHTSEQTVRDQTCKKIEKKLKDLGVHHDSKMLWSTARVQRKIDKNYPIGSFKELGDLGGLSTTKWVKLSEAIYFASRLRSKLSAHHFKTDTLKLTAKDVWNTQNIARYLICHQTRMLEEMPVKTY